jgi:hypothetical protein
MCEKIVGALLMEFQGRSISNSSVIAYTHFLESTQLDKDIIKDSQKPGL